jgi:glycerophosphoryl diester phosphodiesterase
VLACHCRHILVVPWTVNTVGEAERLIQQQVDGLITDFPNLVRGNK